MDTTLPVNQNPVLADSTLGSKWFNPDYLFNRSIELIRQLYHYFVDNNAAIISVFYTVLFFFSLFFIAIIAYTIVRMFEIRAKERKHLEHEIAEYAHQQLEREEKLKETAEVSKNPRWIQTLTYLFSQHAGDWKLAIIEADSMLEELMNQMGFKGETLSDKLKSATEQNKFRGLSSAWEVHNIRNKIAHEGLAFELSQHEAKRVIAIYEQIFREYGFI